MCDSDRDFAHVVSANNEEPMCQLLYTLRTPRTSTSSMTMLDARTASVEYTLSIQSSTMQFVIWSKPLSVPCEETHVRSSDRQLEAGYHSTMR